MSRSTFFVQECPTCGRRLHIRVEYLGRGVVCQHCRGKLVALDPASRRYTTPESADALLRRVDRLIEDAARSTVHARAAHPR